MRKEYLKDIALGMIATSIRQFDQTAFDNNNNISDEDIFYILDYIYNEADKIESLILDSNMSIINTIDMVNHCNKKEQL